MRPARCRCGPGGPGPRGWGHHGHGPGGGGPFGGFGRSELRTLAHQSREVAQLMRVAVMSSGGDPERLARLQSIVERTRGDLLAFLNEPRSGWRATAMGLSLAPPPIRARSSSCNVAPASHLACDATALSRLDVGGAVVVCNPLMKPSQVYARTRLSPA